MLSDTMMLGGGRKAAYSIENSLLFRGGQYLSRTPSVPGNSKLFTVSQWFRRGAIQKDMYLFSTYRDSRQAADYGHIFKIRVDVNGSINAACHGWGDNPPVYFVRTTVRRCSDPSAWYHLVVNVDLANSVEEDRVRIYINGVRETAFQSGGVISNGRHDTDVNKANIRQFVGRYWDQGWVNQTDIDANGSFCDGQLADFYLIDGAGVGPDSFGTLDPTTKSWRPKSVQNVDFGTNGFYLGKPWSSASLGTDYSGKGNHWTPTGFAATDVLKDSPTNVYATLNPLSPHNTGLTLSAGNLAVTTGGSSAGAVSNYSSLATMPFPTTGKYAYRAMITSRSATGVAVGLAKSDFTPTGTSLAGSSSVYVYEDTGKRYSAGAGAVFGSTVSVGQAIDIAFDATSGNAWVGIYNGSMTTWQGSGDPVAGTNPTFTGLTGQSFWPWVEATAASALATITVDFGQRGYVPPSGFKPLCTANLPTPVSAAAKQPGKYYACQSVTHNGTSSTFTLGWNPDPANGGSHTLFRIKGLAAGSSWNWIDTVRGIDKALFSDKLDLELTGQTQRLSSINSSGMCTLGSSFAAGTYLVEAWRVAPEAGFDIVLLDTADVSTQTVLHNNGVAPKFFVGKIRNLSDHWYAYHASVGSGSYLKLNSTDGATTYTNMWNNTAPTATQITLGSSWKNPSTKAVFYIWSEVPGFSKFGAYTGNGAEDGPFDWLGFTPGEVMFKQTNTSSDWTVYDLARSPSNPAVRQLWANSNGQENSKSVNAVDLLCDGVKLRNTLTSMNTNGGTYITAAWAAHPLGAKRVTPATAR